MSTALVIGEPGTLEDLNLDKLAGVANGEYAGLQRDMSNGLAHAIAIGEALNEVARRLPYGQFNPWMIEHFVGSLSAAQRCMRLARNRERIEAEGATGGINEAMRLISGGPVDSGVRRRLIEANSSEAKQLRAEGKTYAAIAETLGFSLETARRYVNDLGGPRGSKYRKNSETDHARYRRTYAQAKAISKPVADAYAWTRRTAQRLDQAIDAEVDRETRVALKDALTIVHEAEDAILAALGLSRGAISTQRKAS